MAPPGCKVTKATGSSDKRPIIPEADGPASGADGPASGYHPFDVNLALGNLVADVAAVESTWSHR